MLPFVISDELKSFLLKSGAAIICVLLVWANFSMLQAKNERIENLNTTITDLNKKVVETNEKYEQAKKDLLKKNNSEQATEEVKAEVKQVEVVQEKVKTQANQYVEKKLAEINDKYSKLEQSKVNQERKEVEISLQRASGLWMTYCAQVPDDLACK